MPGSSQPFQEDRMRRFRNLGSALVMSVLVASGMFTFSTQLHAQSPGTTLCEFLDQAEAAANALPDGAFKDAVLASISAQKEALGCAPAAEPAPPAE
jgi:hypothetical protein